MKTKILTAVLFIFTLMSCSDTQEDKVAEFVKQNMKNPKSFDLQSIEPVDTTFVSDILPGVIMYLESDQSNYNYHDSMYHATKDPTHLKIKHYRIKPSIDVLTRLKENLTKAPQDSIISIAWIVKAYGTNSFNATILSTYEVKSKSNGEMIIEEL